jgi:hypothetical protein
MQKIGSLQKLFKKVTDNLGKAEEDLANEVKKINDRVDEDDGIEAPEGLVSDEIKCNGNKVITGIPPPT